MLKDNGIKTKIIRQYIPVINKHVNKYLDKLNFPVVFELDENFKESIVARYRDDMSYYNLSEGEKSRIDLAMLFAWRDVARLKAKASTNLLILDEVFSSSLDGDGVDDLLMLLTAVEDDTNIFVIDHRNSDSLFDKFRGYIKFEKNGNFSQMV